MAELTVDYNMPARPGRPGRGDFGHYPLVCESCDVVLLDVMVAQKTDRVSYFRADCPKCGDHSPLVKVVGDTRVGPADPENPAFDIASVDEPRDRNYYFTLKVRPR